MLSNMNEMNKFYDGSNRGDCGKGYLESIIMHFQNTSTKMYVSFDPSIANLEEKFSSLVSPSPWIHFTDYSLFENFLKLPKIQRLKKIIVTHGAFYETLMRNSNYARSETKYIKVFVKPPTQTANDRILCNIQESFPPFADYDDLGRMFTKGEIETSPEESVRRLIINYTVFTTYLSIF